MAKTRLEFHEVLCSLIGNRNVYFQPPASVRMKYPCLVYSLSDVDNKKADDISYLTSKQYSVTAIDTDPDSDIWEKLIELPYSRLNRTYTADNLNHWVVTVYF